jgi:hypothetical protein
VNRQRVWVLRIFPDTDGAVVYKVAISETCEDVLKIKKEEIIATVRGLSKNLICLGKKNEVKWRKKKSKKKAANILDFEGWISELRWV